MYVFRVCFVCWLPFSKNRDLWVCVKYTFSSTIVFCKWQNSPSRWRSKKKKKNVFKKPKWIILPKRYIYFKWILHNSDIINNYSYILKYFNPNRRLDFGRKICKLNIPNPWRPHSPQKRFLRKLHSELSTPCGSRCLRAVTLCMPKTMATIRHLNVRAQPFRVLKQYSSKTKTEH